MADPIELTHEELAALMRCAIDPRKAIQEGADLLNGLHMIGLLRIEESYEQAWVTPRGRELVDIAVRAVNAELRRMG